MRPSIGGITVWRLLRLSAPKYIKKRSTATWHGLTTKWEIFKDLFPYLLMLRRKQGKWDWSLTRFGGPTTLAWSITRRMNFRLRTSTTSSPSNWQRALETE